MPRLRLSKILFPSDQNIAPAPIGCNEDQSELLAKSSKRWPSWEKPGPVGRARPIHGGPSQFDSRSCEGNIPSTIYPFRYFVERGGLISYGECHRGTFLEFGISTSIALSEAPSRPISRCRQPTKFELVINLKTAKALGFVCRDKLLAIADEVIE